MSVSVSLEDNLKAWHEAFGKYIEFTSKTPQEALEHRVSELGKSLYAGFSAHQFGGKPRNKGIAVLELKARTADHRGTTIRSTLLALYQTERASLVAKAKALKQSKRAFGGTLNQWVGLGSALKANQAQRISAWQDIVGREVDARAGGIGELGAAFLWFRNRGKGENKHTVLNRRGSSIGDVTVDEGVALIVGRVDGLTEVDTRYNVVAQAIADDTNDTMEFVKKRQEAEAERLLGNIIG